MFPGTNKTVQYCRSSFLQSCLLSLVTIFTMNNLAAKEHILPKVKVLDPFIEMHSGPAHYFPVVDTAEQGDSITLLKQRTHWIKIRLPNEHTGWVSEEQIKATLDKTDHTFKLIKLSDTDYQKSQWEMGLAGGQYGSGEALHADIGYHFTPNIGADLIASQIFTNFSTDYLVRGRMSLTPFPRWRFSPFFSLGSGALWINKKNTTLSSNDHRNSTAFASLGIRNYLGKQFMLQFEYLRNTLFTTSNDNREIDEWQAGIKIFF